MLTLKKTYSSREVAALTGVTARQLQSWDACGLVSPAIASHRTEAGGFTERRYSPLDLFELMVMAELRRRGFPVSKLRQLRDTLQQRFGLRVFEATTGEAPIQLLTDGREIFARNGRGEFFNLLRDPAQPLLVVGEEGKLKELTSRFRGRRKTPAGRSGSGAKRGRSA
jgi:DNA-binding transcriptional MerR regulator